MGQCLGNIPWDSSARSGMLGTLGTGGTMSRTFKITTTAPSPLSTRRSSPMLCTSAWSVMARFALLVGLEAPR
jgi:hypothetical protein